MAAELVDTEGQVTVKAEVWDLMARSQLPPPFFSHPGVYSLRFLSADVEAQPATLVVTAGARAAPRVGKLCLQTATLEKGSAPTVGKGEVVCLQLICCTRIKG